MPIYRHLTVWVFLEFLLLYKEATLSILFRQGLYNAQTWGEREWPFYVSFFSRFFQKSTFAPLLQVYLPVAAPNLDCCRIYGDYNHLLLNAHCMSDISVHVRSRCGLNPPVIILISYFII